MNLCKNCSAPVSENFCGRCGEKVYATADRSFKHLFEEAFHFMTHFEGKFFTTLTTMLKRPGKVSLDFCNGIRKKYFKPLSFYLLLIIAYLLFPVFEGLNMQLRNYYTSPVYGTYAKQRAEAVKEKRGFTEEKLAEAFHQKGEKTSKFMLFTILPFVALFSYVIAFWKRSYYFDHFIFTTESTSFFILYGFLFMPLLVILFGVFKIDLFPSEDILAVVVFAGVAIYASLAAKRFFNFNVLLSIVYGGLFTLALMYTMQWLYKFLLFYVIINLI